MRNNLLRILALIGVLAGVILSVLGPVSAQGPVPQAAPGQVLIQVPAGMSEADARALAESAGCRILRPVPYSPGVYVLETNASAAASRTASRRSIPVPSPVSAEVAVAVAKLKQTPGVIAEPNYAFYKSQATPAPTAVPNDPLYPSNNGASARQQWHMDMIRMPEAWALQAGFRRVVVAVMDGGIDANHPDFREPRDPSISRLLPGRNFFTFFGEGPNELTDFDGHGTHVTGIVGATTNNAVGVTGVAGWVNDPARGNLDIRLLPLRIFGVAQGTFTEYIVAAVNYAVQQTDAPPVDVINMSFGGGPPSDILGAAIQQAIASRITVVAAAGNANPAIGETTGISKLEFPADFPGVIKVTAVGPNGQRAAYSHFGGQVAIAAPGGFGPEGSNDAVLSTWPLFLTPNSPALPQGYNSINGTSMAAPHVSGVAALLIAAGAPRDPAVIKSLIQSSARAIPGELPNPAGGNQYGAGLLDAAAALRQVATLPPTVNIISPANNEVTLLRTVPIQLRLDSRRNLGNDANLQVDVFRATVPRTRLFNTLVGGRDFVVPAETTPGTPVIVTVNVQLPVGQFVVEARAVNTSASSQDSRFFNVETRVQPLGRTMFSVPFVLTPAQPGASKEISLFGGVNFTLARWDNTHTASSGDGDPYAFFRSRGGATDLLASFSAALPDGLPLVFDTANATATTRGASIAPVGLGYWLDLDTEQTLNITGTVVTNPVGIRLFAANTGWNQIGAPFPYPVEWNAVSVLHNNVVYKLQDAVELNIIEPALVGYVNGDYVFAIAPQGRLEPFNGYWVKALQDCILIVPPAGNTQFGGSGTRGVTGGVPAPIAGKGWRVRLQASVAGDRDGQNYFGVAPGAETGRDRADIPKPPSGAGHAYLRFLGETTSSGRAAAYAFDMRPAGTKRQEWTVAVTTDRANADVTLSWAGLGTVPRNTRLTLTDPISGQRLPMQSRSGYTFRSSEAGETRLMKITLEPGQSAGPLAITNVGVTSGRSTRGVSVRFQVNQEAAVRGLVKTVGGKVLARLAGTTRAAATGPATLRWDGRAENGAPVPVGAYVVEITATGADGQATRITRPLLYIR